VPSVQFCRHNMGAVTQFIELTASENLSFHSSSHLTSSSCSSDLKSCSASSSDNLSLSLSIEADHLQTCLFLTSADSNLDLLNGGLQVGSSSKSVSNEIGMKCWSVVCQVCRALSSLLKYGTWCAQATTFSYAFLQAARVSAITRILRLMGSGDIS